jgi:hypothetical protein
VGQIGPHRHRRCRRICADGFDPTSRRPSQVPSRPCLPCAGNGPSRVVSSTDRPTDTNRAPAEWRRRRRCGEAGPRGAARRPSRLPTTTPRQASCKPPLHLSPSLTPRAGGSWCWCSFCSALGGAARRLWYKSPRLPHANAFRNADEINTRICFLNFAICKILVLIYLD